MESGHKKPEQAPVGKGYENRNRAFCGTSKETGHSQKIPEIIK
jgi:hypothetical protein